MATSTKTRRQARAEHIGHGALLVLEDGTMLAVLDRRGSPDGPEALVEDCATPTPQQRVESRLANAGRCEVEPVTRWVAVENLVGAQLVREPERLTTGFS